MKHISLFMTTIILGIFLIFQLTSCSKTSVVSYEDSASETDLADAVDNNEKPDGDEKVSDKAEARDIPAEAKISDEEIAKDTDGQSKSDSETVADETDTENQTEADVEAQADVDVEAQAEPDYIFRILTCSGQSMINDQYAEEQTGDIINDCIYKRNETVKELFNMDITAVESYTSNTSEAINQILSGNDKYDLIFPDAKTAFDYAVKGAATDFNTVSTIDTTGGWWSQDVVNSCTVNGHLYVLDGDISTSSLANAGCILFNKKIFDDLGIDYPYQLVLDGKWTFDELSGMAKLATTDLDGNGSINPSADIIGFYTNSSCAPVNALYAGGQKIYTNTPDGIPSLSVNSAKTVDIFTKLFAFTDSDNAFMYSGKQNGNDGIFKDGRAAFTDIYRLGDAANLRSMADEFGILPWPKFYADDSYITPFSESACLMIMPVTVCDKEKSGEITEALCKAGSNDVIPAFYDVTLQTKFSRDNESEAMLDIIKKSLVYDIGYLWDSEFGHIGSDLADMKNPDFYSYYEQGEEAALSELDSFIKSYGNVG